MSRCRVLVVEDDPSVRAVLTQALVLEHLDVQTVPDGATALALVHTTPFDVLLVDYLIPGMTGLELARAVRCQFATLPIALLTGSAHLISEAEITAAGITRLFPKPFNLDELLGWIRTQLP